VLYWDLCLYSHARNPSIRRKHHASCILRFHHRTLRLYDVAFSASGEIVGGAGTARTVQLWDVEGGRFLHSLRHADEVMALAFSPDGTLLASGGYDAEVYLWALPN
jgi:WD40 repeat protein